MPELSASALPFDVSAIFAGAVCASAAVTARMLAVKKAGNVMRMKTLPEIEVISPALCTSFHSGPAVRHQPLLRQKAALVVHLARAAHPIAEINISKVHALRARDMIEHHESAERPRRLVRLEKRVNHGEPIAEHVGERDGEKVTAAALAASIFDDARLDVAVLDHHGVIEH